MDLQEKEEDKKEKHIRKLIVKPIFIKVKENHSTGSKLHSLAVQGNS